MHKTGVRVHQGQLHTVHEERLAAEDGALPKQFGRVYDRRQYH